MGVVSSIPDTSGAALAPAGSFSAEDAAFLLGGVTLAKRRIDDVRHHTWVLPAALGLALISGTEVTSPVLGVPTCDASTNATCLPTSAVSMSDAPLWSIGSTEYFWMGVVAVALLLTGLVRWRRSPYGQLAALAVAAAIAAVALGVDEVMRLSPLVAPLANVAAIAVAIAAAVVIERSRGLAIAGLFFLITSVALSHALPEISIPGTGVGLGAPSVMQLVAGTVLVGAALGLRRWPAVLPARVLPPFVRRFAAVAV